MNITYGMARHVIGSGLMTDSQYTNAKGAILSEMQDVFERQSSATNFVEASEKKSNGSDSDGSDSNNGTNSSSEDESNSDDDYAPVNVSNSHKKAIEELNLLECWKNKKYHPTVDKSSKFTDELKGTKTIRVGPVLRRGADLPSGKNIADYVSDIGRFQLREFYCDHKEYFPALHVIARRECMPRDCEVGCERFFNLSGYISSPKRTNSGVRDYERIALLAKNLPNIYVDDDWVTREYIRRCEQKEWKAEEDAEALKCWNLERLVEAELTGGNPIGGELTMEDIAQG